MDEENFEETANNGDDLVEDVVPSGSGGLGLTLEKRYDNRCASCELLAKEDRGKANSLTPHRTNCICCSSSFLTEIFEIILPASDVRSFVFAFTTSMILIKARKELIPIVKRNTERKKEQQTPTELTVFTRGSSVTTGH